MKNIIFRIASNKEILDWSFGEVKNSETINYRTLKPEFGGLFCERIFGPVKDYECHCGKYKGRGFKKNRCETCGVELISSKSRKERMAHIKLNAILVNSIYHKIYPSKLSLILNIPSTKIDKIIYLESFVIFKNLNKYKRLDIISKDKYEDLSLEYGKISCKSGGEGILKLLENINIKEEYKATKKKILSNKNNKKKDILRFEIIKSFYKNNIRIENLVLKNIPVIPPAIRPLVELENGKFASSDLNELYRRLINRNNRIRSIKSSFFSEDIINNEKKLLQESLDALMCSGDDSSNYYSNYNKKLKSILQNLKGKYGRFRQNLLGKRVDYSGRSVIVSEPKLKLNQCCIPLEIIYEIFKPFIICKIITKYSKTIEKSKKLYLKKNKKVMNIVKQMVKNYKIILNRAPTLHRLGIQSFDIKITKEKAIKINPLVCFSYNADFDGDQMAVHLPITKKAQLESKLLFNSDRSIFSISNGKFSIFPNQDMILGLYLLTKRKHKKKCRYYKKVSDIINEIEFKNYNFNDSLYFINKKKFYYSTYGRVYLFDKINKIVSISFDLINKNIKKGNINEILYNIYRLNGKKKTITLIEKIMKIGFNYCTKYGFSISFKEIKVSKKKKQIIKEVFKKNSNYYNNNKITNINIFNNSWIYAYKKIHYENTKKITNVFKNILISGAKSNITQIKQIFSFKGTILSHNDIKLNIPIFSSFLEGLDSYQYFLSTFSSRKGLVDTSLKTADSGYLTRRLVNLCQSVVTKEYDCNTKIGLKLYTVKKKNEILGRFSTKDIILYGKCILKKDFPINTKISKKIINYEIPITIRSPIFCKTNYGICSKCYGFDLSKDKIVNIGEAVGIIAAQSIGEPGTQFTMRTFHIGGSSLAKEELFFINSKFKGYLRYSQKLITIKKKYNSNVVYSNKEYLFITDKNERILQKIKVKYGDIIYKKNGSSIKKKENIIERLRFIKIIYIPKKKYNINIEKVIKNSVIKKKRIDNKSDLIKIICTKKNTSIEINYKKKIIKKNYYILHRKNNTIHKGDIFIFKDKKIKYVDNITDSIKTIENLLELYAPKKKSIISKYNGKLKILADKIIIGNSIPFKISGKLLFKEKDYIIKGYKITKGNIDIIEIFENKNVNYFSKYLIRKVQNIYKKQGININNKHFEIVIKQMLNIVQITSNINKNIYNGKKVLKCEMKKNIKYKKLIMGMTKMSMNNPSFIASASFQETGKIISEASLLCKKDKFLGLKENIIVSNLIPVGTSFSNDNKSIIKKEENKKENKKK
ncbi:DNA-directed RNA polymerase subunit beta' [Candidatus Vidania fulgoroideorum]